MSSPMLQDQGQNILKMPGPNHFVIDRGTRYRLDLQILEIKPGAPPAELFDETKAEK